MKIDCQPSSFPPDNFDLLNVMSVMIPHVTGQEGPQKCPPMPPKPHRSSLLFRLDSIPINRNSALRRVSQGLEYRRTDIDRVLGTARASINNDCILGVSVGTRDRDVLEAQGVVAGVAGVVHSGR